MRSCLWRVRVRINLASSCQSGIALWDIDSRKNSTVTNVLVGPGTKRKPYRPLYITFASQQLHTQSDRILLITLILLSRNYPKFHPHTQSIFYYCTRIHYLRRKAFLDRKWPLHETFVDALRLPRVKRRVLFSLLASISNSRILFLSPSTGISA